MKGVISYAQPSVHQMTLFSTNKTLPTTMCGSTPLFRRQKKNSGTLSEGEK
jgi:hypothetical protein